MLNGLIVLKGLALLHGMLYFFSFVVIFILFKLQLLFSDDTKEDILIHHSGIKSDDIRGNSKQQQSRRRFNLYEKEKVVFDIFRSKNF